MEVRFLSGLLLFYLHLPMVFPYMHIDDLLCDFMTKEEDEHMQRIMLMVAANLSAQQHLTLETLIEIGYWKSPRLVPQIKKNEAATVQKLTRLSYHEGDLVRKTEYLLQLQGITLPMASAILMFYNPYQYGIMDTKVWQVLYQLGMVDGKASGKSLKTNEFELYTLLMQNSAKSHQTTLREVEQGLLKAHAYYFE